MGRHQRVALATAILFLLMPSAFSGALGENSTTSPPPGTLLDVRIINATCLNQDGCEPQQPHHLIEYYSADWCEPCLEVSQDLRNLHRNDTVVLQHHPSPSDSTFLSDSKLRYDQEFRLLFYPTLVVDGTQLLTGTRQALDLGITLNNTSSTWTGLESLRIENESLEWNASENGVLRIWYAEPTPHEFENTTHPSVARSMIEVNASTGEINLSDMSTRDDGFFVIMLELPGQRHLEVASLAPVGQMDLSDSDQNTTTKKETMTPGMIALMAGLFLFALLLPALVMQRRFTGPIEGQYSENATAEE
jgi:hypothetical protein